MPPGRIRLPARAGVQLSSRPRRRVRFALADPALRSAHRRHRERADPAAQGRRTVFRADQSRRHQLRAARGGAQQDLLRQSDAALSAVPAEDGNHARKLFGPRHGSADAHRQGAARADRGGAAHRQDHAVAVHRQLGDDESSGSDADRAADRRAPGRSHRHAAVGEGRSDHLHLRRARFAPRASGRDGDRKGQAIGGAQERRRDSARFHHAAGAGL